ncbi:MAG: S8 family serine peptidase, partial [Planctomycetales bacterium]|nr:S8 family serine peptidase [Planctomycetales bacterium]
MITGIVKDEPKPAMFREKETGLLRLVHKEIALRFADNVNPKLQKKILLDRRLDVVSTNTFIPNQFIVKSKQEKVTGEGLLDLANAIMDMPEVVFATPNFVSEYQRHATATIPIEQWHLENTASVAGQKLHEDVKALKAWRESQGQGRPAIVVAVLDDGVDVEHPNLTRNVLKNPDPTQPLDLVGRDFYINDRTNAEHFNPRPKQFQYPYDVMTGNDIHGTPCAGVIAAAGKNGGALGIASKCKILPVKIFHGDNLASDANVADAIRYAAKHASILSCSWSGGSSPNIEAAIRDAGTIGRGGKGSAVICASGNESRAVGFPASHPQAIAVGASTDQAKLARYSNTGPEICVVAPSSGGKRGIFTTDVSIVNRGFNLGSAAAGGVNGLHTNDFGGTSSATPLVAGVAALVLSAHPNLTRDELRDVLKRSTIK